MSKKYVEIDGKVFETNGVWEYGPPYYTGPRARTLPVGQIGWKAQFEPIPLWERAALAGGEKEILRDIPRILGGGNLINLGDLKGGSAILMAQGLEHHKLPGHVFTVDCYADENPDKIRRLAQDNRHDSGMEHRITMIEATTDEALRLFTSQYEFVFIDADHSYEGVRNDFLNYSPLISETGMVAFHDTNQDPADSVIKKYVTKDWKLEYWVNRIKIFSRR